MDQLLNELGSIAIVASTMAMFYRVHIKQEIKRKIHRCYVDIDNINRDDPSQEDVNTLSKGEIEQIMKYCSSDVDKQALQTNMTIPAELLYGIRMSITLDNFLKETHTNGSTPNGSITLYTNPAVFIACRAQHIGRWKVPRSSFPDGKQGYFNWRKSMYQYHADLTKNIMKSHGFDDETTATAENMIMKKNIKGDIYSQLLEDIACLVFLKSYFSGFLVKFNHFQDEKVVGIVKKTWEKMSDDAHNEALKLPLNEEELTIVKKALGL